MFRQSRGISWATSRSNHMKKGNVLWKNSESRCAWPAAYPVLDRTSMRWDSLTMNLALRAPVKE